MFESPEARGQAQPAHDGAAEEEDPDVAFARALMARCKACALSRGVLTAPATQEEEAREWNARMLAMAGLPAPGGARRGRSSVARETPQQCTGR